MEMSRRILKRVKICPYCNKEFHPFNLIQKFCSLKCLYDYRHKIKNETDCKKPKKCVGCGKEFRPLNFRTKYCSRDCFLASIIKKDKINCPTCGKEFLKMRVSQKYCSRRCGEPIRKSKKTKKSWIDLLWAELVKLLAGVRCEYCGKTSYLNSHHIFSRAKLNLRWDTDNGICLCTGHHLLSNFSAHKSPIEFYEWLKEKRGEEWYDNLRAKSREIRQFSDADKLAIVATLKARIKEIKAIN